MKTVEFLFDFASPNAYLVHRPLNEMATRTGAQITNIPCLLGGIFKATGNQAPMITNAAIPNKMAYEKLEFERFIKKHKLYDFNFNPHFPVNTLHLMRGAVFADQEGFLDAYMTVGFHHMWEDPKNLGDPDILAAALTSSGLDGEAIAKATQDPVIKTQLIDNTQNAVARGVFGVPTLFVGDEMFFGKDRLRQVEDLLG